MEENKDLIPNVESENTKSQEVVAVATTDEVNSELVSKVSNFTDNKTNGNKAKKDKKPMPKNKKIIVITAMSIVGAIILGIVIWLMVIFLGPSKTQDLSSIPLKVDMANEYYIGIANEFTDYSKIFPDGSSFTLQGNTLTFKQGGKTITKNVNKVDGAVNVTTFDELVSNINAGNKVVVQNANIKAPKLAGTKADQIPTMNVKNDIYGNGAVINVNEIVATRKINPDKNDGNLAEKTDCLSYTKSAGGNGSSAFTIVPREDGKQVIFQDVHITGNDMSNKTGGDLDGLSEEKIKERGVKLFSGYGALLYVCGNDDAKSNAIVKHCVFENAGKVVHIQNSNVDFEGNIVRNASDTAVSIATIINSASTINMKNNVIANSLTGGILFYCDNQDVKKADEATTWNTLNITGFLDIYNWKRQDSVAIMPETEGAELADFANPLITSTVQSKKYDNMKVADEEDNKYIHFAIIKIRTGAVGDTDYNGSKVNGYKEIGYFTSTDKGYSKGFPIPGVATYIMKNIDVWGYFDNKDCSVKPTDGLNDDILARLYTELRDGRK